MSFTDLGREDKTQLLQVARKAIEVYLKENRKLTIDFDEFNDLVKRKAASFVTLRKGNGELRGCIGNLEADQALILDVAEHAVDAACNDIRFKPITSEELSGCSIEISVLTPTEIIPIATEQELLEEMQPNIDGIVLDDGFHRATFLPKVWQSVSGKDAFLKHLKLKAGLSENQWPRSMKCYRYRTIDFSEGELGLSPYINPA